RRPAAVPGHRRRGRRRHPPLSGARRLPLRVRSHGAGAARGPGEHGALRERRAGQAQRRAEGRGFVHRRREDAGEAVAEEERPAPRMISHQDACALIETPATGLDDLVARAGELRDRGRGRTVTFSAKVFIPLTTLCRDYCGYCTFRRDPGERGAHTMTPEEV